MKALAEQHQIEKDAADKLTEDLKLRAESAAADIKTLEERQNNERLESNNRYSDLVASNKASNEMAVARILKLFYFSRVSFLWQKTFNPFT